MQVLYVYSVTRPEVAVDLGVEAVDESSRFGLAVSGDVAALYTPVSDAEFSQEVIDSRGNDLEWLGAIGYRHQAVVSELMKRSAVVPLRAFTLFRTEDSLRQFLSGNAEPLKAALDRLDGKQEWTLRIEFDAQRWEAALARRVDSLRALQDEIAGAPPGKAFLLRKKLEDEKKHAFRTAEEGVVAEIEAAVVDRMRCETLAEMRERRDGAFPQINVLVNRDEEAVLQELHEELLLRYDPDGVSLALSGPWPPYTFAAVGESNE